MWFTTFTFLLLFVNHDIDSFFFSFSPTLKLKMKGQRPYFSSFAQKEEAAPCTTFDCLLCKANHEAKNSSANRLLLLSDSMFFRAWQTEVACHVDCEILNGATIAELTTICKEKYLSEEDRRPLLVVMVAGINDVMKGQSADEILSNLYTLKSLLKNHNPKSLLSTATLPLSPRVCSLYVSSVKAGSFYDLPEGTNKIEILEAVNCGIMAQNKGLHFLKLSEVGVKGTGLGRHRNARKTRKFHIDERFTETKYFIEDGEKKPKLHLTYFWRHKFLVEAVDSLMMGLRRI